MHSPASLRMTGDDDELTGEHGGCDAGVEGHPNRTDFRGVLTLVDVPSQGSPQGAQGHRVVLTRAVAERALPSLIGMALDYTPSFDRHDMRCKVGVITQAEMVGRNLEIGGYLFAKDFPEMVREIGKREERRFINWPGQQICAEMQLNREARAQGIAGASGGRNS